MEQIKGKERDGEKVESWNYRVAYAEAVSHR
jgi:hypothetical protein